MKSPQIEPQIVTATQEDIDALLAAAKPTFSPAQYLLLQQVLDSFMWMMQALNKSKTTIARFRQWLFGPSTESKDTVLPKRERSEAKPGDTAPGDTAVPEAATPAAPEQDKPRGPGHGRNGADAYRDAPLVECSVAHLHAGQTCPECGQGRVYDSPPKILVKIIGQPPLAATRYRLQRLRCRLCDAMFTAALPEGVSLSKYDHSSASMLALLRYGNGMPLYRLEHLQASLNVALPDATQWDILVQAVPAPRAVFDELTRQAAQARLLHNDDTPMTILELKRERAQAEAAGLTPVAKAISTSGIIAFIPTPDGEVQAALFFTGHQHAGDHLASILTHRDEQLDAPIQMCDALAANIPDNFKTVLSHCIAHGRRKFVEVLKHFPQACTHVIEVLAQVYANDAHCRQMSPQQRLAYHQQHSQKPMLELKGWMTAQLDEHHVEPHSGLGQALGYMLRHWDRLTQFLHVAGAPLDNNICERALKRAILHRKNSMFYKTRKGAEVGDIYMSLIQTCELCGVNAFDYLNALQGSIQAVTDQPALWLPWNYRQQVDP